MAKSFDQTPEYVFSKIKLKYFGTKEDSPLPILITTLFTTFFCYFYHMVNGLGCPDTLTEGVYVYRNADFATSLARWMIRYLNELFGKNIVIPAVIILLYCLMIGVSAYIICRMTGITDTLSQIILTSMMVSFPVILHQIAYMYIALCYSFSFLAVTFGILLIRTRKISGILGGTFCFLLMMGSYQAYIGAVAALALIMLISDMLREKEIKTGLLRFALSAACGLAACIINIPFSSLMMKLYDIEPSSRVTDFSISAIFKNLGFSLKYCYVWFFSYFRKDVLSRNRLYAVIFIIIAVLCILTVVRLVKEKKTARAVITFLSVLVLPPAMNLLLIVYTSYGMQDILRYQYVLIFALMLILMKYLAANPVSGLLKYPALLAVIILFIGNVVSGNCTAYMYKIYYDHYGQQFTIAMGRIYELEGYTENVTRIVIGGTPSCDVYHMNNPKIFRYAEIEGGPVFWYDPFGMTSGREYYFKDFLGIDPGVLTNAEYHDIVHSQEYAEMPLWPAEGSVRMINGMAVIKFSDTPPVYY